VRPNQAFPSLGVCAVALGSVACVGLIGLSDLSKQDCGDATCEDGGAVPVDTDADLAAGDAGDGPDAGGDGAPPPPPGCSPSACASGTTCRDLPGGGFTCVQGCQTNADCSGVASTCCANTCVDVTRDVLDCGSCGTACPTPANATPRCALGTCDYATCLAGYADCDGDRRTGCELNVRDDPQNCGACGRACSTANVPTPVCSSGACTGACRSGWGDCNRDLQSDGCETPLDTSDNCGACGHACGASQTCDNGACTTQTCTTPLQGLATPTASEGGLPPYGPSNLNDGLGEANGCATDFSWVTAQSTPGTAYFEYDWPSPVTVYRMHIDTVDAVCNEAGRNLAGATIQTWNGTSWDTQGSVSGESSDWDFVLPRPAQTTRLRLYAVYASSYSPGIYEWTVTGCHP
jgi:hypothetical protein